METSFVMTRPARIEYYMSIAVTVRNRADCLGRTVGAILVRGDRIVSTGYNGTPSGMPNCTEGGCVRCQNRKGYASGKGYDVCVCVHAEQNTILAAARFGNAVEGSKLYTTLRPCFSCLKESLQAGIREVYYLDDFQYEDPALIDQYKTIEQRFDNICHIL